MLIRPGLKGQIAHALDVLMLGEQLAHECAQRQAPLAAAPNIRRFLALQARQERFHARIFRQIVLALDPRARLATMDSPAGQAMARFRERLAADLQARDLPASLVGMQLVLEGVGAAMLKDIDHALGRRGDRFAALRHTLRRQEEAHHAFGLHTLERLTASQPELTPRLRVVARDYHQLGSTILSACDEAFHALGAITASPPPLPTWLCRA